MRLLTPANPLLTLPLVFATARGMSDEDAAHVAGQIAIMSQSQPNYPRLRNDLTCAQLFDGYARSIAG